MNILKKNRITTDQKIHYLFIIHFIPAVIIQYLIIPPPLLWVLLVPLGMFIATFTLRLQIDFMRSRGFKEPIPSVYEEGIMILRTAIFLLGLVIFIAYGLMTFSPRAFVMNPFPTLLVALIIIVIYQVFARQSLRKIVIRRLRLDPPLLTAFFQEDYPSLERLVKEIQSKPHIYQQDFSSGLGLVLLGKPDQAINLLEQKIAELIPFTPHNQMAYLLVGAMLEMIALIHIDEERFAEAEPILKQVLDDYPTSDIYCSLAMGYWVDGQIDKSEQWLNWHETIHPTYDKHNSTYLSIKILLAEKRGQPELADQYLETYHSKVLKNFPHLYRAYHHHVGMVSQSRGNYEEARQAYQLMMTAPEGTFYYRLGQRSLKQLEQELLANDKQDAV